MPRLGRFLNFNSLSLIFLLTRFLLAGRYYSYPSCYLPFSLPDEEYCSQKWHRLYRRRQKKKHWQDTMKADSNRDESTADSKRNAPNPNRRSCDQLLHLPRPTRPTSRLPGTVRRPAQQMLTPGARRQEDIQTSFVQGCVSCTSTPPNPQMTLSGAVRGSARPHGSRSSARPNAYLTLAPFLPPIKSTQRQ